MANWYIDHVDHAFDVYQTVRPENLSFTMKIREPGTVNYDVTLTAQYEDGSGSVVSHDFVGPYRTGWRIRRNDDVIFDGVHTSLNVQAEGSAVSIAGMDWLHYLQRRMIPFDARSGHHYDYAITSKEGFFYETTGEVDINEIVGLLWASIFGMPNSVPLTFDETAVGVVTRFRLTPDDTSTFLSMIDGLSEVYPGFDYWVSTDRIFYMASPYRFGSYTDVSTSDAANILFVINNTGDLGTYTAEEVNFTNNGPIQTHIFGQGAGYANKIGRTLNDETNQETFWRLDGATDYGDQAHTLAQVKKRTRSDFLFGVNPVHEISVVIDPARIPDFWSNVRPGLAFWLKWDLVAHMIDSPQRIVSMQCDVNNQGDEKVTFGCNQIYNTDDNFGLAGA